MTDRVDDLESEIAELRAAVNGLTEELVETKARVRELEDEADAAETDSSIEPSKSDDHVEVVEQKASDETGTSSFEADNSTETEESTDTDEAESGEIIVA